MRLSMVVLSGFLLSSLGCGSDEGGPASDGSAPSADGAVVTTDAIVGDATAPADAGAGDASTSDSAGPTDGAATADAASAAAMGTLMMTLDGMPMTAQVTVGSIGAVAAIGSTVIGIFGPNNLLYPSVTVNIPTPPSVGTFDQTMGATRMNFNQDKGVWLCDRYKMGSSCTLTLTKVGGPGEDVTGTFTGTLVRESATGEPMVRMITAGSFSFKRGS
jgi:hypothetical protein